MFKHILSMFIKGIKTIQKSNKLKSFTIMFIATFFPTKCTWRRNAKIVWTQFFAQHVFKFFSPGYPEGIMRVKRKKTRDKLMRKCFWKNEMHADRPFCFSKHPKHFETPRVLAKVRLHSWERNLRIIIHYKNFWQVFREMVCCVIV